MYHKQKIKIFIIVSYIAISIYNKDSYVGIGKILMTILMEIL